jgi:hypothetical protein
MVSFFWNDVSRKRGASLARLDLLVFLRVGGSASACGAEIRPALCGEVTFSVAGPWS